MVNDHKAITVWSNITWYIWEHRVQVVQVSVLEISNSERDLEVIIGNCLNMSSQHKAVVRSSCTLKKVTSRGGGKLWIFSLFCTARVMNFLLWSSGHISPNQFPAIAEAWSTAHTLVSLVSLPVAHNTSLSWCLNFTLFRQLHVQQLWIQYRSS